MYSHFTPYDVPRYCFTRDTSSPQLSRLASERRTDSAGGALATWCINTTRAVSRDTAPTTQPPTSTTPLPPFATHREDVGIHWVSYPTITHRPASQPLTKHPPLPDPASRSSQSPTSSTSAPCTKSTAKRPPLPLRMSLPTAPKAAPPTLPRSSLARTRSTSTSSFAVVT